MVLLGLTSAVVVAMCAITAVAERLMGRED